MPAAAVIRQKAWEIHRCPEGYDGPCWGPTQRDLEEAERLLRVELSDSNEDQS